MGERFQLESVDVNALDPADQVRISDLKSRIREIKVEMKRDADRIADLESELASFLSPVKVGDLVEDRNGRQARVTAITGLRFSDTPKLVGVNVRKDGTDGAVIDIHWYSWRPVVKSSA